MLYIKICVNIKKINIYNQRKLKNVAENMGSNICEFVKLILAKLLSIWYKL